VTRTAVLDLEDVLCGPDAGFELTLHRFVVHPGEAIALVGPSGSGKSTLLNLLGLAEAPRRAARFALATRDGAYHDIAALWRADADARLSALRARHQGYVLQQGGLLPFLDIGSNIHLALDLLGQPDTAAVQSVAERLGLAHLLRRPAAAVSVGERQRAAIARAIVHRPDIVLADEPTANVHPSMADTVLALLRDQARESGAALVLATHDVARAEAHGFTIVPVLPHGEGAGRSSVERAA
jgi:putative ABC transport system ATP-binding protein